MPIRAVMAWIPIAVAATLLLSLSAGLVAAAVLGKIAARLSELDDELWAAKPAGTQRSTSDR
jgi:hypothetical protein